MKKHDEHVRRGFQDDPVQRQVAVLLDALLHDLVNDSEPHVDVSNWLRRVLGLRRHTVKGLYLWGNVGRGKTYLMDLFFEVLPLHAKRRLHFHRFMRYIHDELKKLSGIPNPLQKIAKSFHEQARVLCFDEFFVSDIGDAMILAQLLEGLIDNGTVLVVTSNVAPDNLYENGLQRRQFLPAIDLIKRNTLVFEMRGTTDYRMELLRKHELYHVSTNAALDAIKAEIKALSDDNITINSGLTINDRIINAQYTGDGAAAFSFKELCDGPRSADDYLELSRLFHTVVIYDVPVMNNTLENQARRFISLVDVLYDHHVNLVLHAHALPDELYTGSLHKTEFVRTKSRIVEMQSERYLACEHQS